jgi:hypothetical protein
MLRPPIDTWNVSATSVFILDSGATRLDSRKRSPSTHVAAADSQ